MCYIINKSKPLRDTTARDYAIFVAVVSGATLEQAATPAGIDPSHARAVAHKVALALMRFERQRNPNAPKVYEFKTSDLRKEKDIWLERLQAFKETSI